MEFIIVIILASIVFAVCFAVFLLKGRHSEEPPRLHACHQGDDCHCRDKRPGQERISNDGQ